MRQPCRNSGESACGQIHRFMGDPQLHGARDYVFGSFPSCRRDWQCRAAEDEILGATGQPVWRNPSSHSAERGWLLLAACLRFAPSRAWTNTCSSEWSWGARARADARPGRRRLCAWKLRLRGWPRASRQRAWVRQDWIQDFQNSVVAGPGCGNLEEVLTSRVVSSGLQPGWAYRFQQSVFKSQLSHKLCDLGQFE